MCLSHSLQKAKTWSGLAVSDGFKRIQLCLLLFQEKMRSLRKQISVYDLYIENLIAATSTNSNAAVYNFKELQQKDYLSCRALRGFLFQLRSESDSSTVLSNLTSCNVAQYPSPKTHQQMRISCKKCIGCGRHDLSPTTDQPSNFQTISFDCIFLCFSTLHFNCRAFSSNWGSRRLFRNDSIDFLND